jgi:hypothetical protein
MGAYRALDGPWSPCNVTTRFNTKALRDFPILCLAKCRNANNRLWTFQRSRSADDRTVQIVPGYRESGFRDF